MIVPSSTMDCSWWSSVDACSSQEQEPIPTNQIAAFTEFPVIQMKTKQEQWQ
jgi:hypothetical protein